MSALLALTKWIQQHRQLEGGPTCNSRQQSGSPPCPPVADRADRAQNVKLIWQTLLPSQRLRLIQAWRRLLQQRTRSATTGKEGADEAR